MEMRGQIYAQFPVVSEVITSAVSEMNSALLI